MQNIEVSEGLTIGGAPPLKQDAIDKLQAQIIFPTQTIYVSNTKGNDETGTGSSQNPVKTLDKALELIKTNTTNVEINLDNTNNDEIYTFTSSPFISKSNISLTIRALNYWDARGDDSKKPIIKPILYLLQTNTKKHYFWSYYIACYFQNVTLENIRIVYPDGANIVNNKNNGFLFYNCSIFNAEYCIFTLITNSKIIKSKPTTINQVVFRGTTITGISGSSYLTWANETYVIDNDTSDNPADWNTSTSTSNVVYLSINKMSGSNISNVTTLGTNCTALSSNID